MTELPKNILIYRLGSLGDTVIALPCFHKIREVYPKANITLLTNKPVMAKAAPLEAVLGRKFFFNQILAYPIGTRNPLVLFRLIKAIRNLKCDTVINITALRSPKADKRDKLFFRQCGIKHFIGFENTSEDFQVSVDPHTGFYEWEAKRLARKIKELGPIDFKDEKYWDLRLSENEVETAKTILNGFGENEKVLAINAGTKMPVKDWGSDNWRTLIKSLSQVLKNWKLLIIGVREEYALAEELRSQWSGESLNLCGKTVPRVSAEILKSADIFIGHDSGPLHLAACVGTPCVGIYSGLNKPKQWFPRGENNILIFPETTCEKCDAGECKKINGVCILTIKPSRVANAVNTLVQKVENISFS